jgi:hypothetical protein
MYYGPSFEVQGGENLLDYERSIFGREETERIDFVKWTYAIIDTNTPWSDAIPKGLYPPAQGCEPASYPGSIMSE